MAEKTYWNGEPAQAVRGLAVVADVPEMPLHWAKDLVGQRIPVVLMDYNSQRFYLDDRDGSGWRKVTAGRGSPRFGHGEIRIVPGSFWMGATTVAPIDLRRDLRGRL
jgi:hypothetical protein